MALGAFNSPGILMTWPAPIVLFNGSFVVSPEKSEKTDSKERSKEESTAHTRLDRSAQTMGKFRPSSMDTCRGGRRHNNRGKNNRNKQKYNGSDGAEST